MLVAKNAQREGIDACLQTCSVEEVATRSATCCELRSVKIGKSRRITDQHLAAFIASLEDDAA